MRTLLPKSNEMTGKSCESKIVSIECSMCGDVGLKERLFKCTSCLFRYQHTYCSSLYPKIDLERFLCEWCHCSSRQMVGTDSGKSGSNKFISNKLQRISASNGINLVTRRGDCKEKSDVFISVNGRRRRKVKENPNLRIHARRRYKRLADLNF